MKAWMVREVCKTEKCCSLCPLNAKYEVDNHCIRLKNKYNNYPSHVTGYQLIELLEDEEEY